MHKLSEARGDTAVFTFGRFNPPTTGHEKLIKALASQVVAGAKMYVYPSHSQNAKKDPLPHAKKIAYMKKMFPRYSKNIITSRARNIFEIAVELYNKGHKAIIMVVGSDRVDEFDRLLNTYNGEDARHGFYGFDDIKVISAGERDPDAEGVAGMSASKMRAAAAENDYTSFQKGLPKGFREGEKLFADVRKFMGVNEENWTFEEIIRDAYIRGEIFNIGEEVTTLDSTQGKIVRKGTNYVVLETNDGFNKFWISDLIEAKKITKTKQVKGKVGDVKGSQPAKYYSKDAEGDAMSKDTKLARAKYFAKGGSRGDAPGDIDPKTGERQKTKPSQYTKKFKQMYGEQEKEPPKSDQQKKRDEFDKLQKAKRIAALQYRVAKDQETIAKMSQQNERSLTDAEKKKLKELEKEIPMKSFKDRYGKDGESVYYATLTKMAKNESHDLSENEEVKDMIKHYEDMLKSLERKKKKTPGMGFAKIKIKEIIAKLKKDLGESYEIGKDYADHTKEIDPYSAPQEEKTTLKKDKKLPNLMIPKKGKSGVTKFMRRKNLQKLAADNQFGDIDEQMEAQDSLKNWKHDDAKSFAEGLIKKYGKPDEVTETMVKWYKLQPGKGVFGFDAKETYVIDESIPHSFPDPHRDFVYTVMEIKVPSDMLDTLGHVTGSIVYDGLKETVTARCGSLEANALTLQFVKDLVEGKIENDNDVAKKTYADRIRKGPLPKSFEPVKESLWANIHKKRQRIKQGSGERMRKKGEKGAPTAAQMKRAKGEEVEVIDEKIAGLVNKSEKTGVPYSILKKSYDRGMAAWKGGHRPGATQQQWAFARVNSMLTGGKADPDLQKQIKAGGYKKKKKAKKENVEEWFNDTHTKQMYKERYGSEWEEKLNNTYERMLSKLDESCCEDCAEQFDHMITEAEYQGKTVKLNDPIRTSENPNKKFKVYVKNEKGKVVVVRFGDPNMGINRDDPEARKSFRARHNCDNPGPKTKARYWSCFQWRAGAKVDN